MPLQTEIERPIVWQPIPGSSQELALDTRCNETLYTGSRGPGKSDTQLMRFRRRVGIGYGVFWRGIIFDREYKHLDDLVAKSKRWFPRFNDGAQWLSSTSAYKWVWPTGEELLFRVMKDIEDYDNYHGQEYPFIGFNELTKYPDSACYDKMLSCNRSSFTPDKDAPIINGKRIFIPDIPLEVFSTCNSSGPGHHWVKSRFIDAAPYGQVVKRSSVVFNPRSGRDEEIVRTQVTIFGSYKENIYLDPQYVAGLDAIKDENLRKSWLEGDWNVVAGGALDDVWKNSVHIKPKFKVPDGWHVDRSLDWGSSHPFSAGWWAEANGEEATLPICSVCDGDAKSFVHHVHTEDEYHEFKAKKFCPAPGSLIQIGEWYGTKEIGSNKGLKYGGKTVGKGIAAIERAMMTGQIDAELLSLDGKIGFSAIALKPWAGPADNQIRDVHDSDSDTIEKNMADQGISWTESDKGPGSRKNGLQLMRDRLENAIKGEGPGLYFMDCCRASIATIPVLPRDEKIFDDVDTSAEDHAYDMVRYRVLKGSNRLAESIKTKWAC